MAYTGKVFSFKHNWASPVIESLEWLTEVLPARSGLEQRIRLRNRPRRTLEYSILIGGTSENDKRRRFDAFVWANQDQDIVVPVWTDAEIAGAGNTLNVDKFLTSLEGKNYDADGYVIVWRSYRDYEVVKIDSVTGSSQVNFEENLAGPLTGVVAPARLCKFNPETNGVSYASDLNSAVVQFEQVIPAVSPVTEYRATAPTVSTYRTYNVWNKNGNDGSNVDRNFARKINRVDFQTGQVRYDSIQTAPTMAHGHNRLTAGRAELAQFLGWLNQREGQRKPFWIPSYERDFEVAATAASGQPVFTAKSFGYTANYLGKDGRRDIAIVRPSGLELHRIISATDDGTTETITLDANLAATLNTTDRVSFARFCRLDHDRIELTWHTAGTVQVNMKLRELFKTA